MKHQKWWIKKLFFAPTWHMEKSIQNVQLLSNKLPMLVLLCRSCGGALITRKKTLWKMTMAALNKSHCCQVLWVHGKSISKCLFRNFKALWMGGRGAGIHAILTDSKIIALISLAGWTPLLATSVISKLFLALELPLRSQSYHWGFLQIGTRVAGIPNSSRLQTVVA